MMKQLFSILCFLAINTVAFSQFSDTSQLKTYFRDTIKDRRPEKVTAAQIQKGLIGTVDVLSNEMKIVPHSTPNIKNFRADTVSLVTFDITKNTTNNGLVRGSTFTGYTETTGEDGLTIDATGYSGSFSTNAGARTSFESGSNDVVAQVDLVIVSKGSTNPLIGITMTGATDLYSISAHAYLNISTGTFTLLSQGTTNFATGLSFANGQEISIAYRRRNDQNYFTVVNKTTRQSWTGTKDGRYYCGTHYITNTYPGFEMQDGIYKITGFKFYGYGYQPDLLLLGSSVTQSLGTVNVSGFLNSYDSSIAGQIALNSNLRVAQLAKSANRLGDMIAQLQEVRKYKPKVVIIEAGHNELLSGMDTATWHGLYRNLVDSLLSYGIKVVVEKLVPSTWVDVTSVNSFVDKEFGKNKEVYILNLYNTTPLYNEGYASNKDPQYYCDLAHLVASGAGIVGRYIATQMRYVFNPAYDMDAKANAKVSKQTGDRVAYYRLPYNPFSGDIEPIVKNGAADTAVITPNGVYDNVDVTGGDNTSYIQLSATQNNDALRITELRVKVTDLYTNPLLGFRQVYVGNSAHNNTNPNRVLWVNLLTNVSNITTNISTNTSSAIAAEGDILLLRYYYDIEVSNYVLWVYNETTNKYIFFKGTGAWIGSNGFGTAFPAIVMADGAYTILDFKISSGNPSGAKVAITGDSMGSGYSLPYTHSIAYYLNAKMPYNVDNHTAPGQMMEGMARCLKELIETRPQTVFIINYLAPYYDDFNPADGNYAVYIEQFRGQLKAIKAYGGVPILVKIKTWPLITNTQAGLWNAFCDAEAASEGGVLTMDLSALTPAWDATGYHYNAVTNNTLADMMIDFLKANNLY